MRRSVPSPLFLFSFNFFSDDSCRNSSSRTCTCDTHLRDGYHALELCCLDLSRISFCFLSDFTHSYVLMISATRRGKFFSTFYM
jgi:hypothetical protein